MSQTEILLTGFEPFNGRDRNPSAEVARAVGQRMPGLIVRVLPVAFATAGQAIETLLAEHRPAIWIGLGLNERASGIVLERQAANWDDARIPDNAGDQRRGQLIEPDGPAFYPATLPLEEMAAALALFGIPHAFSDSAGRFVCNHVFYRAAQTAAHQAPPRTHVGFVHLPWPNEWGVAHGGPSGMTLATMVDAVATCLAVCAGDGVSPENS